MYFTDSIAALPQGSHAIYAHDNASDADGQYNGHLEFLIESISKLSLLQVEVWLKASPLALATIEALDCCKPCCHKHLDLAHPLCLLVSGASSSIISQSQYLK